MEPPWSFVLCECCGEYTLGRDLIERALAPDGKWKLLSETEYGPLVALEMLTRKMCGSCGRKQEGEEKRLDFQSVT